MTIRWRPVRSADHEQWLTRAAASCPASVFGEDDALVLAGCPEAGLLELVALGTSGASLTSPRQLNVTS